MPWTWEQETQPRPGLELVTPDMQTQGSGESRLHIRSQLWSRGGDSSDRDSSVVCGSTEKREDLVCPDLS